MQQAVAVRVIPNEHQKSGFVTTRPPIMTFANLILKYHAYSPAYSDMSRFQEQDNVFFVAKRDINPYYGILWTLFKSRLVTATTTQFVKKHRFFCDDPILACFFARNNPKKLRRVGNPLLVLLTTCVQRASRSIALLLTCCPLLDGRFLRTSV